MQVNELRIGNYLNHINYDFHEDEIIPDGTYDLHIVDIETLMFLEGKMDYYTKSGFQPIPLTEEFILKFGFEDITGIDYILNIDVDFKIILIPADGFYCQLDKAEHSGWQSVSLNKIEYVHQLQDLHFALTQTELRIK